MGFLHGEKYADGDRLEIAGAAVRLRVSKRSSRVSLRVDRLKREVIATAPSLRRLPEAAAFARERAGWMAQQLASLPAPVVAAPGTMLDLMGRPCLLERTAGRAKWISGGGDLPDVLMLAGDDAAFQGAAVRLLKREAHRRLAERTAVHAAVIGRPAPPVRVMDAKTRWGSCSPGGPGRAPAIRYNWRLILAPFDVADYVAAHEVCHLIEANHGPKFWALVAGIVGDHRQHRDWLKREGARLHAFGR